MGLPGWAIVENTGIGRISAAALGAIGVLALVVATASRVRDTMALLLVGLMIGILAVSTIRRFSFSNLDEFLGNLS